jgi:hypothetical protein
VRRWQIISAAAALLFVIGGGGGVYFAMQRASTATLPPPVSAALPAAPPSAPAAQTRADSSAVADSSVPGTPPPNLVVAGTPRESATQPVAPGSRATQRRISDTAARRPAAPPPTRVDSQPAPRSTLATRDTGASPAGGTPAEQVQLPPAAAPSSPVVGQLSAPLSSVRADSTPPRVVTPPPNPRTAATAIVDAYARAIATRSVEQLKRVYPGMTPSQQSAWESFFSSVRAMTASLQIDSFSAGADTAVARVTGAYEFVTRAGRNEHQPASFTASFARDGERWRLVTVR